MEHKKINRLYNDVILLTIVISDFFLMDIIRGTHNRILSSIGLSFSLYAIFIKYKEKKEWNKTK